MIGTKVTFRNGSSVVIKHVEREKYEHLTHAARSIRKDAAKSVMRAPGASEEGEPPHTHRGAWFRRALWYDVDRKREDATIGFRFSKIGTVARTHEFGEREEGRNYPIRPTIYPALERNIERFHRDWRASVG
ncbi:MAG: hypothetical protein H8E44_07255 [Planctomycetes bacterium]|nr:hypothetical protein [Planctomycetota bacterium]